MYERLDAREILKTAERLEKRISERFQSSSLSKLAARLSEITRESIGEAERLQRPNILLRVGVGLLLTVALVVLGLGISQIHVDFRVNDIADLMQGIEATLGILFFLGTGVFFFVKLEERYKRRRTLAVVHKLRTVAHIVDMHQLTKEPEAILKGVLPTASSPKRSLSEFELRRYLDYACELLALVGKVAALYAEGLSDAVVLEAVDDLEDLTGSLISKIWQKLVLMERWQPGEGATTKVEAES
jgi:hypothetical protein